MGIDKKETDSSTAGRKILNICVIEYCENFDILKISCSTKYKEMSNMNVQIGEKIRSLRKQKNISQEVLAQYLGVSFQAVSKWENGTALPDVTMIPAIACFFEVSTDELFDFNRLETEEKVLKLCGEIARWRYERPEEAELAYRELLKQYPGNDIIMANLLYALQIQNKHEETVSMCKTVMAGTKYDDVRFDAARIMAETYKEMGEYALCKQAIDLIPEFFFTHREEKALLLEGEDMFRPAWQEKCQAMETFLSMTMRIADYYVANNEPEKAKHQLTQARDIALMLKDDLTPPFWKSNIFEYPIKEIQEKIEIRLSQNTG